MFITLLILFLIININQYATTKSYENEIHYWEKHTSKISEKTIMYTNSNNAIYIDNFSTEKKLILDSISVPDKYKMLITLYEVVAAGSRYPSEIGNNFTVNLIKSTLGRIGLDYIVLKGRYEFNGKNYTIENIVLPFIAAKNTNKTTLIMVHIDSYSINFAGHLDPDDAPGADDDATGIIALLFGLANVELKVPEKNVVIAFVNGEIPNNYGSKRIFDWLRNEMNLTITSVFYFDRIGNKDSQLAVFSNNRTLTDFVTRLAWYLTIPIESFSRLRSEGFFNEELFFDDLGIDVAVISESNYANAHIYTEDDKVEDISIEKVVNATLLFESIFASSMYNLKANNSISEIWVEQLRKLPNVTIADYSEISSYHINENTVAIIGVNLNYESITEQITQLRCTRIILFGNSLFYLSNELNLSSKVFENVSILPSDVELYYHPIIKNVNFPINISQGFFINAQDGLSLAEADGYSGLWLSRINEKMILYMASKKPFAEVNKIIQNFMNLKSSDVSAYLSNETKEYFIGDYVAIEIYFKDILSWKDVNVNTSVSVVSPDNKIVLERNFEHRIKADLNFTATQIGIYDVIVNITSNNFVDIFHINIRPVIKEFSTNYSSEIYQGDIVNISISFKFLKNDSALAKIIFDNRNTSIAINNTIEIKPGYNSINVSFSDTWLSGTNIIRLNITINNVTVFTNIFSIPIKPLVNYKIKKYATIAEQQEEFEILLSLKANVQRNITVIIKTEKPFTCDTQNVTITYGSWVDVKLKVKYETIVPYDFGIRALKILIVYKGHIIALKVVHIDIKPSLLSLIAGFVVPLSTLTIASATILKRRKANSSKSTFDIEISRYLQFTDSITISQKHEKSVEKLLVALGFSEEKGLFFDTFSKRDALVIKMRQEGSLKLSFFSYNPLVPFRLCEQVRLWLSKKS